MRKVLGYIGIYLYPLLFASPVLAQTPIDISPPPGAIKTEIFISRLPQFLIQFVFVAGIVISIAFLIYGGIKWVLSGGDKTKVEAARGHIVAAIIGLVIIAGAYTIIAIIFQIIGAENPLTGKFCIPTLINPKCTQ